MNTQLRRKTHPMVLTAAAAVTVFSLIGSAALTGLIPSAHSGRQDPLMQTAPAPATASTTDAQPFRSAVTGNSASTARRAQATADSAPAKSGQAMAPAKKAAACKVCGVVESIAAVEHDGEASGLGAVAGGVVGGIAGNQVGKGKGNTLMTIIGLGGGAYAGHAIEQKMKSTTSYIVKVRMEDGTTRKVTQAQQPTYAVGDHVRVVSGSITSA